MIKHYSQYNLVRKNEKTVSDPALRLPTRFGGGFQKSHTHYTVLGQNHIHELMKQRNFS